MRVLVTGGAGYVGSHACKQLARAGHIPVVFDDLSTGHSSAVRWGPLVQGGLGDTGALNDLFGRWSFDAVLHFAGSAQVGESVANPLRYYANNVVGTFHLLEAMMRHDVKRLVFSSSCAVYGEPEQLPLRESHPLKPINPYGETKRIVEQALQSCAGAYGLHWIALRYFNAAGADPELEIGESHDPETHLIPRLLGAALGNSEPFRLYGTDYPTEDGTAIRDYVHVVDLADAHVLALAHLARKGESCALNVGTGKGYSVRSILRVAEEVVGRSISVLFEGRRAGDPPVLVADPEAARTVLGWNPSQSEISRIVQSAWYWMTRSKPS